MSSCNINCIRQLHSLHLLFYSHHIIITDK
jgi:hypothetical protein